MVVVGKQRDNRVQEMKYASTLERDYSINQQQLQAELDGAVESLLNHESAQSDSVQPEALLRWLMDNFHLHHSQVDPQNQPCVGAIGWLQMVQDENSPARKSFIDASFKQMILAADRDRERREAEASAVKLKPEDSKLVSVINAALKESWKSDRGV